MTGRASVAILAGLALGGCDGCGAPDPDPTAEGVVMNATYLAPGTESGVADFSNGQFRYTPPDGAAPVDMLIHRYATGDLDGDGRADVATVIVERPDGFSRLFRLHAGINNGEEVEDIAARLLGDRITVDSLGIVDGEVVVAMGLPAPGMPPGSEVTRTEVQRFAITDRGLIHADAGATARLSDEPRPPHGTWRVIEFRYADSAVVVPAAARPLELTFAEEMQDVGGASGRLFGSTGCNRLFTDYRVEDDGTLRLLGIATTRRGCPEELDGFEQTLITALASARRFMTDDRGRAELGFVGGHLRLEPSETEPQ